MRGRTLLLTFAALGCGPVGMAVISIEGPTVAYRDGAAIKLRLVATDVTGVVGKGTVRLETDVGVLEPTMVTLDEFGTAQVTYSCDASTSMDCLVPRALVKATWALKVPVSGEWTINLRDRAGSDGGTGGGASGVCPASKYSHQACSGLQTPGREVKCCYANSSIPSCSDVYPCNGQSTPVRYLRQEISLLPDGGFNRSDGGETVIADLLWTIPYRRAATVDECKNLQLGYEYRLNGLQGAATQPSRSYGAVSNEGSYSGLRIGPEVLSLHNLLEDECVLSAAPDGGPYAIWNSMLPAAFFTQENGRRYAHFPAETTRFFFLSLLRTPP